MENAIAEEEERNQNPVLVETKSFFDGKEEPDQEKSQVKRLKTEELVLSECENDEDEFQEPSKPNISATEIEDPADKPIQITTVVEDFDNEPVKDQQLAAKGESSDEDEFM